jgi:sigma-B regulation protein RsbU (phosphoserine phosphatase)
MEPESSSAGLLLVDDDKSVLRAHVRALSDYAPLQAEDGVAAREILRKSDVDVVVCDLGMPCLNGLDLMRWAKDHCPRPAWVVVSGQDTFDAAAEALKLGAFDFICKPVLPMQLRTVVGNAMRHQQLVAERASLARGLADNNVRLAESLRKLEKAYEVLREQRSMLDQDLHRAERIMRALLPHSLPMIDGAQLNVGYRPSNTIGGDLYGAEVLGDRHLVVYVADAAGHGVSAALLAVLFNQRLRLLEPGNARRTPADMLADLNRDLLDECRASGLFVTAIFALIDVVERTAIIASAGHPPGLLVRRTGAVERVATTGPALGLGRDAIFEERRVSLALGDRLFLYTDGLTSSLPQGGPDLDSVLGTVSAEAKDGGTTIEKLLVLTERGGTCEDDVTLLLFTANGGTSTVDADQATSPSAAHTESLLRIGSEDGTTWVAVHGHAEWKDGPSLRKECLGTFDAGGSAVIDLGACTMLDSTILGTLHELVTRATPCTWLRIQRVPERIRRLFVELSMTQVLSAIVDCARPLPPGMAAIHDKGDSEARGLILHAHELLSRLSAHNAEQFGPVVEALRRE